MFSLTTLKSIKIMFIYRFSKLIKSKVIWCFLIALMAFAFVFAGSCSSPTANTQEVVVLDTPVSIQSVQIAGDELDEAVLKDAEIFLRMVDSPIGQQLAQSKYFAMMGFSIPPALRTDMTMPYFFDPEIFTAMHDPEAADGISSEFRQRAVRRYWKVVAAIATADRMGLLPATEKAALAYLKTFYMDPANPEDPNSEKVYNEEAYKADLQKLGFDPTRRDNVKTFERVYANVIYPLTLVTRAVEYTTGWGSPMELDLFLSAEYDTTVARAVVVKDSRDVATITVSEDEIKAWYENNKANHTHPEQRTVEYVAVPMASFIETATANCNAEEGGIEILALEYYESNRDSFKDKDGNQLPYEGDVVQQAIEKVKLQEAIKLAEEALNATITDLNNTQEDIDASFAQKVVAKYGATTKVNLPADANTPAAVRAKAFEMDLEEMPFELCSGDEGVYVVRLTAITPEKVKTLDEVRAIATTACQQATFKNALKTKNDNVIAAIKDYMAAGKTLQDAVAAVSASVAEISLTDEVSFTRKNGAPEGDYSNDFMQSSMGLAPKQFATSSMKAKEAVTVYVEKRYESEDSAREKSMNRHAFAVELSRANQLETILQWLDKNLDLNCPTNSAGTSVLETAIEE